MGSGEGTHQDQCQDIQPHWSWAGGREGFALVTADRWKKLITHVQKKVEDHYWSSDGLYEQFVNPLIIHFGGESDSDDAVSSDDSGGATETASSDDDTDSFADCEQCSCEESWLSFFRLF